MTDTSAWEKMRASAPFAPEAFRFVQEGLRHTIQQLEASAVGGGDEALSDEPSGSMASELIGSLFEMDARPDGDVDTPEMVGHHVSGQQLCMGLRSLAMEKYGLLAPTVLRGWGVRSTEDFGKIVYAMVDAGLLRTSENDSMDDFRGVYDFDEAFDRPTDRLADCGGGCDQSGNGELG